ncbi:hypothetical protein F4819DRAFT_7262 [Hypoxylon fuscum]|nr:hypothetical protein F4819DRAFT_7262 [Hypoxylon fuscum]
MASVTEIVLLPIKPDTAAAVIDTNMQTLLSQPGCLRVRQSRVHEDPAKLRLFADWESLEQHQAFVQNAAVYGPFRASMASIVDAAAGPRKPPYHAQFAPFPPAVLDNLKPGARSKVTELLLAYFPAEYGEAQRETARQTTLRFTEELKKTADAMSGEVALGWSVENDVDFKGEPCRVLVTAIGWDSIEQHVKARETEGFAKAIPMLRNLEGLKGMEMCHLINTTTERGN